MYERIFRILKFLQLLFSYKGWSIRNNYTKMKALKCKMLGTELAMHTHCIVLYVVHAAFTLTTIYLILTFVGNGRQLNLPRGNFND